MVNTYTVLLAIHVLAAVLWVGGGATLHAIYRMALSSGDRQRMLQVASDGDKIGPRMYAPLSLILLIAGIFLVSKAGYEQSDLWVTFGYVGWLISFVIGVGYYPRAKARRERIVEAEGLGSDAFIASYRQVATVNVIELTILLLIVIDMAIRPM